MHEVIELDDLIFEIRRSRRRRTIGLTIDRDASLVAHLPEDTPIEAAIDLLKTKLVWIYQKLARSDNHPRRDVFRQPEFVDGEGFYFLGKHYRLKLIDPHERKRPVPTVRFQGEYLLYRREQVAAGERRVAEYYAQAARPYLNDAVARWSRILGVRAAQFVNVLDLGFRWGSCSSDATLNFHWRIMQLPPPIIDYVVVHELAHLKVPDHSPKFWNLVSKALPNYQEYKNWLRKNGGKL